MWALDGSVIGNGKAAALLDAWRQRHHLHSHLWLPLRQAAHFHVHPLTYGASHRQHLALPLNILTSQPPRAVPFSHLPVALQGTLVRSYPPPFSSRGFPMLVEPSADLEVGFRWRHASAAEFLDGCLFPCESEAGHNRLLADPRLATAAREVMWPQTSVPLLNIQETTNPFAIDASLRHLELITQTPLPPAFASGLTTVAAQFAYPSLMWVDADALNQRRLRLAPDQTLQSAHRVPVTEEVALYHVSQLSEAEQTLWLGRIPRFVLLNSLTTAFILFRSRWLTARRFGLATAPSLGDAYEANPALERGSPQPLLWVCASRKGPADAEPDFVDSFIGSPLMRQRNHFASFFNAAQLA